MHRHEVEPEDALTHTKMRHGHDVALTPVAPTATAIFFGASYHADYATLLAAPADLPAVADALAGYLAEPVGAAPVGRRGPPAPPLRRSGGRRSRGRVRGARDRRGLDAQRRARGRLPGRDPAGRLRHGRLPRRPRQEGAPRDPAQGPTCRRRSGEIRLDDSPDPLADLETFIDLHQKRWGADGLFPDTPGGAQSRVLFRRLFELHGPGRPAPPDVPQRRRPAHRVRHPFRDRRTATSTTTPESTPTRATCRRAS